MVSHSGEGCVGIGELGECDFSATEGESEPVMFSVFVEGGDAELLELGHQRRWAPHGIQGADGGDVE